MITLLKPKRVGEEDYLDAVYSGKGWCERCRHISLLRDETCDKCYEYTITMEEALEDGQVELKK